MCFLKYTQKWKEKKNHDTVFHHYGSLLEFFFSQIIKSRTTAMSNRWFNQ